MPKVAARIAALLVALACVVPGAASATTVIPLTFDDLIRAAREIFIGQVVATHPRLVDTRDGRAIVTLVTFRVDEVLKGGVPSQTSIELLGGTVGDVTMQVVGLPEFRTGDRDVLFVGGRNEVSPIVGFMQGRFRIARDPRRGVDTVRTHDGRAVSSIAEIGRPERSPLTPLASLSLSDFRAAILAHVQPAGGVR